MELMFAPRFKVQDLMQDLRLSLIPKDWRLTCSIKERFESWSECRKADVRSARQIAAENAAWWLKEAESCRQIYCLRCENKTIKRIERKFTDPALVMYDCVWNYEAWMKVYNQGQLYAKDTVKPFDPAYGEGKCYP